MGKSLCTVQYLKSEVMDLVLWLLNYIYIYTYIFNFVGFGRILSMTQENKYKVSDSGLKKADNTLCSTESVF